MEELHGHTLEYWKNNAEEDYLKVPISVLKYITCLEERIEQLTIPVVVKSIRVEKEKVYQDIEYQVSTFEGHPIMEVMTIEEQKDIEKVEGLSVSDVIDMNISSYRDWQCDC